MLCSCLTVPMACTRVGLHTHRSACLCVLVSSQTYPCRLAETPVTGSSRVHLPIAPSWGSLSGGLLGLWQGG